MASMGITFWVLGVSTVPPFFTAVYYVHTLFQRYSTFGGFTITSVFLSFIFFWPWFDHAVAGAHGGFTGVYLGFTMVLPGLTMVCAFCRLNRVDMASHVLPMLRLSAPGITGIKHGFAVLYRYFLITLVFPGLRYMSCVTALDHGFVNLFHSNLALGCTSLTRVYRCFTWACHGFTRVCHVFSGVPFCRGVGSSVVVGMGARLFHKRNPTNARATQRGTIGQ